MRLGEFSTCPGFRWRPSGFVLAAAFVFCAAACAPREGEPASGAAPVVHSIHSADLGYRPRPDILFLLIDTLRPDHLGAYGYGRPTSPAVDRLAAEEGILFQRAYSVAPWTNPSIATLFTGKYPRALFAAVPYEAAIRQALPKNVQTLAEILRGAGYRTLALIDHPGINQKLGYGRGFDEFRGLFGGERVLLSKPTDPESVLDAFKTATAAVGEAGQPIFVYLHLVYPHRPYAPPAPYAEMFGPGFTRVEKGPKDGVINMYDAEIRQTDDLLAKIFAEMKARGWYERTAIVFTADHGEGFWEHGIAEHGRSLFNEEIRVPLVVVPPGGRTREPRVIDRPVSNVGLFATVLDFAGVLPPPDVPGESLLRFVRPGGAAGGPEWFFSESPHSVDIHAVAALSSEGQKYLRYRNPDSFPEEMIFDLAADPSEGRNLAGFFQGLGAYRSRVRAHEERNRRALDAGEHETVEVEPETRERLRALGYLD